VGSGRAATEISNYIAERSGSIAREVRKHYGGQNGIVGQL
jgi:hypothetical protein